MSREVKYFKEALKPIESAFLLDINIIIINTLYMRCAGCTIRCAALGEHLLAYP
jgi:hypothetical protein